MNSLLVDISMSIAFKLYVRK